MWWLWIVIVCAVVVLLWLASGAALYRMTLSQKVGDPFRREVKEGITHDENARSIKEWAESLKPERVEIAAPAGKKPLVGLVIKQPRRESRWVVLAHGHGLGKEFMFYAARTYYGWGFNILTIDLRGHGESPYHSIGMGWPDRLDIVKWCEWITGNDPACRITLFGISMGAAAVLSTSGEALPGGVKSIVADCGFTGVADIFRYLARHKLHLPPWLVLPPLALAARLRGLDIYKASALDAVRHNTRPLLLIHGEKDDFVPTEMVYRFKEAAGERARLLIVPEAGHSESCLKDPEGYWDAVEKFATETTRG